VAIIKASLILSATQGGMPELLAPCWEWSAFKWRLCNRELWQVSHNWWAPASSCLLSFPRLADTVSSLGWYARTAGSLLRRINLQMDDSISESSFVWLPPLLFYSHIPLSFHENQGTKVTTRRAPCKWKALIQRDVAQCPKGIVNDTAIANSEPCSPQHDTSHLGFGEPEPFTIRGRYPLLRWGHQGLDFGGASYC
jgi:hypothetical protein